MRRGYQPAAQRNHTARPMACNKGATRTSRIERFHSLPRAPGPAGTRLQEHRREAFRRGVCAWARGTSTRTTPSLPVCRAQHRRRTRRSATPAGVMLCRARFGCLGRKSQGRVLRATRRLRTTRRIASTPLSYRSTTTASLSSHTITMFGGAPPSSSLPTAQSRGGRCRDKQPPGQKAPAHPPHGGRMEIA